MEMTKSKELLVEDARGWRSIDAEWEFLVIQWAAGSEDRIGDNDER
jgi:hypothetical protein